MGATDRYVQRHQEVLVMFLEYNIDSPLILDALCNGQRESGRLPTPGKPPPNPPSKSIPTNPGAPAKPPAPGSSSAKAGPASPSRQNAETLDVSPLGLDFIREWESGSLTKNHLNPYNDNKGFCAIGIGHLIDGKR
jgi:hypothetical protein